MALKCILTSGLTLLALLGLAPSVAALSDVPTPGNYVRRSVAKATVLGNFVYVDGGEISQLGADGKIGYRQSNQVNSTLSIDISQSWKTSSVTIRSIPKAPLPPKQNVHLWTDTSAGAFYSWGGKFFLGQNMTKTELHKFAADGKGGGTWSVQEPGNPSLFGSLTPGEFSAVATVNDTGYLVGGVASGWTEQFRGTTQVLPGMVTFNMQTRIWQNGTIGFSPINTLIGAEANYIPAFGPNGLIIVLGGYSPRVDAEPDIKVSPSEDFQNVTFFDPVTKKAYWQVTTGDIPPSPRGRFCTTGFRNTADGYDIFLFGGINQRDMFTYNDAYILSLPGFVWTKLPDPPAGPRAEQTCVAVGNRQVLSIGGTNPNSKQWTDPDAAPNGLLVFDMTAMKWTDSYDAKAAPYESPDIVKSWYSKGSLDSIGWSSPDVQKLFATANDPPPPASDPASAQPPPGDNGGEKSGASTGAIAGGVVGGIAVLVLAAAIVWFAMRRKKKTDEMPTPNDLHSNEQPFMPATETKYTYGGPQEVGTLDHHELSGAAGTTGKYRGGSDHHELHGGQEHQELHAGTESSPPVELYGGDVPRR